jgi:hypothetical protein
MIFYAENEKGNDIFYIEISNCQVYGNLIESSLPESVFKIPNVLRLIRRINKCEINSLELLSYVDELIEFLKGRNEYSYFYFQEVELKVNGKFNIEQSNTMIEIILNQPIPFLEIITINSNPFLFRLIYKEILLFEKLEPLLIDKQTLDLSIEEFINNQTIDLEFLNLPVEYRITKLKYNEKFIYLNVKYQGENPTAFYFKEI